RAEDGNRIVGRAALLQVARCAARVDRDVGDEHHGAKRSTHRVRAGGGPRLRIVDGIRVSSQWRDREARPCAAPGESELVGVEGLDFGGRGAATNRVDGAQGRALHEARGRISTVVVAVGRGWYRNAWGARRGSRRVAASPPDRTAGGCAILPVTAQVRLWR